MDVEAALEVACGKCLVTKGLLHGIFSIVDLMDQSQLAYEHMKETKKEYDNVRGINKLTM